MTTSEKEKGDKSGPFTIGMLIQEDTNNDDEADTEIVYYSTGYLLESNYNQAVSGSNAQLLGGTVITFAMEKKLQRQYRPRAFRSNI